MWRKLLDVTKSLMPKQENKPLGRWSLKHGEKAYTRADLSNEDHCGTCSSYALQQNFKNISKIKVSKRDLKQSK